MDPEVRALYWRELAFRVVVLALVIALVYFTR